MENTRCVNELNYNNEILDNSRVKQLNNIYE